MYLFSKQDAQEAGKGHFSSWIQDLVIVTSVPKYSDMDMDNANIFD